jgi:hypothetical protein
MCKLMTFPFIKNCVEGTVTVNTSFLLTARNSTSPYVNDRLLCNPHNIYKVPIKRPQIEGCTTCRGCTVQSNQTYTQVLKTLNYVKTVESSSQVKGTSKHTITEGKSCSSVFKILTINKQQAQ